MTREEALIVGLANGVAIMLDALVRRLDKDRVLSKDDFASHLEQEAAGALQMRPATPDNPRLDVILMQNVARLLRDQQTKRWTPTVIEGGQSVEKDDQSSDSQ